jgi:endonuclease YncB( thermonuclease family)
MDAECARGAARKCMRDMKPRWLALVLVPVLLAWPAYGEAELRGRIVGIVDGDTLDLLTPDRQTIRLRLHGIDAPEAGQAHGAAAKEYAARLCFGSNVLARILSRDRNGRSVAEVTLPDNRNVGRALVEAGLAWWEPRFAPNDKNLERLEADARQARRGLWADLGTKAPPVRPSEHRNRKGRQ